MENWHLSQDLKDELHTHSEGWNSLKCASQVKGQGFQRVKVGNFTSTEAENRKTEDMLNNETLGGYDEPPIPRALKVESLTQDVCKFTGGYQHSLAQVC